ncbi:MAG: tetratricopeptide repeat protein [Candidatus Melainabacteria bacterium]|nr:tetratricopeptide repeat protein [Candidatus Melainabacteria bacterium]
MSDSDTNSDRERSLKEAKLALKTGMSAYENDNFKLAEPLFIKALDKFEQLGETEDPEFFQCLVSLADTLYHLRRYYEAKGYYERLSVGRLKAQDSSDAQVVVALLKLAATHEKLEEVTEALTTFELTLELAENTIPPGHALFGVIFDSFEILIERHVQDPEEKKRLADMLASKREEFGFSESMSGIYRALPSADEAQTAADRLLAQPAEDIRKNLSAWTHTEISSWANEVRAQRAKSTGHGLKSVVPPQEVLSKDNHGTCVDDIWALKGDEIAPGQYEQDEKMRHLRLSPEMFRPKALSVEKLPDDSEQPTVVTASPLPQHSEDSEGRGGRLKRVDTDRRPFNPLPVLTVVAVVVLAGGAIYMAREYAKTMVANSTANNSKSSIDLSGKTYYSSDRRRQARFITRSSVELTDRGQTMMADYGLKSDEAPSPMEKFFGGGQEKLVLTQVPSGFQLPDGTVLLSEDSDDQKIVDKMQALANFATFFYGGEDRVYPSKEEDFVFGSMRFAWDNPLTPGVNKPIIDAKSARKEAFDQVFATALSEMRDKKSLFPPDDGTGSPRGLIECIAIGPEADCLNSAFLIRAYGQDGKFLTAGDPSKALVIALKSGVTVDVLKASRTEDKREQFFKPGKSLKVELVMTK